MYLKTDNINFIDITQNPNTVFKNNIGASTNTCVERQ